MGEWVAYLSNFLAFVPVHSSAFEGVGLSAMVGARLKGAIFADNSGKGDCGGVCADAAVRWMGGLRVPGSRDWMW